MKDQSAELPKPITLVEPKVTVLPPAGPTEMAESAMVEQKMAFKQEMGEVGEDGSDAYFWTEAKKQQKKGVTKGQFRSFGEVYEEVVDTHVAGIQEEHQEKIDKIRDELNMNIPRKKGR